MIAPGLTLSAFYEQHYLPLKLRSRADNTRRLYEFSVRSFGKFLDREALLADLTDENVSRHLADIRSRGLSPFTVNKERSQLLAIWRFACRKGFLDEWPDVDPEIQPRQIPRAWTADELDRLFRACLDTRGLMGSVPAGLWWYGLHLLGWDTGERIAPLRNAEWSWVDLAQGRFLVPASARKGQREDRQYDLHPDTIAVLKEIRAHNTGHFVFPFPFESTYIYHLYAQIQRRANLPVGAKFRFHCLRKSVASHGKAAGLDPQELMGHKDGRTTLSYLDPGICGQLGPARVLFRPGRLRVGWLASLMAIFRPRPPKSG